MRKRPAMILWIALFLVGCQSQAQPQATPAVATRTAVPATQAISSPPMGCTLVSPRPTPGPTEQSVFPSVSAEDWVSGPEEAAITFVEYGDFQ